jgi:hypothetical protein
MSNLGDQAVQVFFVTAGIAFLAIIGLGVFYLVGPREPVTSGEQTVTAESGNRLEGMAEELVLNRYQYDPSAQAIEGSVINNTQQPYVNVQVGFTLLGIDSTRIGTVRDTTSELKPGATWAFRTPVSTEAAVEYVVDGSVTGGQKNVEGGQTNPPYPQR